MLDPTEDNSRMKAKLSRNSHGLKYLPNFLAQQSALQNGSTDDLQSVRGSSVDVASLHPTDISTDDLGFRRDSSYFDESFRSNFSDG